MSRVRIRPAQFQDHLAIRAVLADTFESTWKPKVTAEAAKLQADRAETFVAQHGPDMHVADDAGEIVGMVLWREDFVDSLHVKASHARRGIGAALLRLAESRIGDAGFAAARLETDTFNLAARAFYAARGYREAGRYPDEEWNSGLTTLLLVKSLGAGPS